ncbi:MAG: hypothetical protein JNL28_05415 [Planctomycetes bacterium]|nr:hypothetical protein [Planctomycetota bacterium]
MSCFRLLALATALSLVAAACSRPPPAPKFLTHTLTLPKNPDGVFLNEDLVFFFSGEIDRASITQESVQIKSVEGRLARGSIAVNGHSLTFMPAPVLARDLSDGGFLPGTRYVAEIHGFPWVDGLRGMDGEPLRETLRFHFTTVSASTPIDNLLFVDPEPDKTRPLGFFPPPESRADSNYLIGAEDSLYLDSDKPIDPTSLRDEDFVLRPQGGAAPVAVRARLVENAPEARVRPKYRAAQSVALESFWESQPRAALIELTPKKKLNTGLWWLSLAQGEDGLEVPGPRDFSGHPLWGPSLKRRIDVGLRGRDAGKSLLNEDFIDTQAMSNVAVPEADGTAYWGHSGRVEVRYPAAAGDGSAGHVQLAGALESTDLQAISLRVEAGARATLPSTSGLVVLRAQGALRIAGELVREVAGTDGPEAPLDLRVSPDGPERSVTLTDWLALARAENRNVTVLIAGGDLVIEATGKLRTNTTLLLVAGGTVRAIGPVRANENAGSVYLLGGGGGEIKPSRSDANLLLLDPPCRGNPLREELHYAVLSQPLPQRGRVAAWTSAQPRGSANSDKQGVSQNRWSVRYVREVGAMPNSIAELNPVERPQALEPAGSIQMLIELWVAPGASFEPPFVDHVQLNWVQEPLAGSERGEGPR